MGGDKTNESFGLRHLLSSGVVSEIQERHIQKARGEGTSETIDRGDLRGVQDRGDRVGNCGRSYSCDGILSTITIDRGSGEDNKEQQCEDIVSRVSRIEEEALEWGDVGGWIFCPNGGRSNDS